ncbi:unnamed protein product [Prorocentrum cordatum]|uniref:Uncharacterized protein n=1 Tax=Prorocentrum cordatum TaxID=2364126 RepID=A0ABN9RX71_9DINO|nr:unnamed protein product [Polarella glacialis]
MCLGSLQQRTKPSQFLDHAMAPRLAGRAHIEMLAEGSKALTYRVADLEQCMWAHWRNGAWPAPDPEIEHKHEGKYHHTFVTSTSPLGNELSKTKCRIDLAWTP